MSLVNNLSSTVHSADAKKTSGPVRSRVVLHFLKIYIPGITHARAFSALQTMNLE